MMNVYALRRFSFLFLVLSLAPACVFCKPLPEAIAGPALVWSEGLQHRNLYQGPGVYVLATSAGNAAQGIQRYQNMLADLEPLTSEAPAQGLILVVGEDDRMEEPEIERLFLRLLAKLESGKVVLLEREDLLQPDAEGKPLALWDRLLLASYLVHVEELQQVVDWQPVPAPSWGLTLATEAAARGALGRIMDTQMRAEGKGWMLRSLAPLALGLMEDGVRRSTSTQLMLLAAFPGLEEGARKRISQRLRNPG